MASFTKTINNAVQVFGSPPSQKWGQTEYPYTMTWGTSLWGETGTLPIIFRKVIDNSIPSDTIIINAFSYTKNLTNAVGILTDMSSGVVRDGTGSWSYVFPSNTNDAENVSRASWTVGTRPDVTFVCAAAGSTVWT